LLSVSEQPIVIAHALSFGALALRLGASRKLLHRRRLPPKQILDPLADPQAAGSLQPVPAATAHGSGVILEH
jgi:hypothetical protein